MESAGAAFLVSGNLLIEGIEAHKLYTNHPGYDVLVVNPVKNKGCRVQVKNRWATDFDGGFQIKNFDCDFVVFVALNRATGTGARSLSETGANLLTFTSFRSKSLGRRRIRRALGGLVFLKRIDDLDAYLSDWEAIRVF